MAKMYLTCKVLKEPKVFDCKGGEFQGIHLWTQDLESPVKFPLVGFKIPDSWKMIKEGTVLNVKANIQRNKDNRSGEYVWQFVIDDMAPIGGVGNGNGFPHDSGEVEAGGFGEEDASWPFGKK
jgi:hypothetical protein